MKRVSKNPGFWFILLSMALITALHYEETIGTQPLFYTFFTDLGFTRYAFLRMLYLAPIVYAGFLFGWKGGITTSCISLAGMLPRVIITSPSTTE